MQIKKYSLVHLIAGWQPKRTIVFCSWGGEEQGLIGSTEWVEVGVCFISSNTYTATFQHEI